jgi:hypothetical protein
VLASFGIGTIVQRAVLFKSCYSSLGIIGVDVGLPVLADIRPELFFECSQRCQELWTVKVSLLPSRILVREFRKI